MLTEECDLNPLPRAARHRGRRHRPRRVDRAAAPRAAQPHRAAGDPHQEGGGRRAVPRAARHRRPGRRPDRARRGRARRTCARSSSRAEAGLTGVNFAIAETGGFVVCTNEGNADLGVSLPKLHIACMGIEKLIPRAADLRRVPAAARPLGDGAADHRLHLALPRPAAGRRAAHRARRQRPQRGCSRDRSFRRSLALHPLRRVHQHLPGLPPQRRAQLRRDRRRADRLDPRRRARSRRATRACRSRAACAARAPTCAR